jgi:cytochrome o ubiquinol oxidase subunit 2
VEQLTLGKKYKWIAISVIILALLAALVVYLSHSNIEVLNPKGTIAYQERRFMIYAASLSLLVVVPVFILTFVFAYKYREGNKKAKYRPNFENHLGAEFAWWAIPSVIIVVLSVIAWDGSHTLDPYKKIAYKNETPVKVEVIALDWKWLFIYPQQKIATVNTLEIPVNRPVSFALTTDAPMNSFWIPQLGGQIYAMPGMLTQLNLMATQAGSYHGESANISGAGFAGMDFMTKAVSTDDYNSWVKNTQKQATTMLNYNMYNKLARPSQNDPPSYYTLEDNNIMSQVMDKYMMSGSSNSSTGSMSEMSNI